MAEAVQAPMAMIVADFDTYHGAWDAANGEMLEVGAGTAVRLLDYADGSEYWRVELVDGGRAGLVARTCALPTSSGGKGDWGAAKGTADATIAAAVEQGLTSENFDLSQNVANNDTRLVDPAVHAMEAIMEREGCDFDEARNLYNRQKMLEAGIDPDTGLSLDPKAVTNAEDFERVFSEGQEGQQSFSQRAAAKIAKAKAWWVSLIGIFGIDFIVFISVANFLFGLLTEWYAIFLAYYLKDDLKMKAAESQAMAATAGLAYQLRPLCGVFSDSFPLLGSTRHSWFFVASMAAAVSQALLLSVSDVTVTTILLFLINFFGATWVFVISGAMIAEVARKDPEAGAENLQSVQWGFYSLGMFTGDMSAGPLFEWLCDVRTCFALSMVIYFALAFAPFAVMDQSASDGSTMSKIVSTVRATCSCLPGVRCTEGEDGDLSMQASRDNAPENASDRAPADLRSAADQMRKVWRTVDPTGPTEGTLLRPAIYIFFCVLCVPDYYYGATYYFYTSQPIQEANGCAGSVSTAVRCSEQLLLRSGGGCEDEHWRVDTFGDDGVLGHFKTVTWPQDYTSGSSTLLEWSYTTASEDGCSACEAFQLPSQEGLCKEASNCVLETRYEGTGCQHIPTRAGGIEGVELSGSIRENIVPEGCVLRQACVDIADDPCPSDSELEQAALAQMFRVSSLHAVEDMNVEALDAVGEVEAWLDQSGAEKASADGYGYGYGYGYGSEDACTYIEYGPGHHEECDAIQTARYFVVLSESDNTACDVALCNVTVVDECTSFVGGLGFDPAYWSHLQALGSAGSMVGTFVFASLLAQSSLRRTFVGVHLVLALVGFADVTLARRWNVAWGIDDEWFAGLDQFMYWLSYQCKMLPIYSLATRICPPGVEATMIAIVLSLKDLGYTISTYYGAVLTTWAGIEENECFLTPFDNLWMLYAWRIVCRLMPVVAVVLVPTEEQIAEAMDKLVQADKELGAAGLGESLSESDASNLGASESNAPETATHTTQNPAARAHIDASDASPVI